MKRRERFLLYNILLCITAFVAVAFGFKTLALISSVLFIATVPKTIYECMNKPEHSTSYEIKNKDWRQCYNIAIINKVIGETHNESI